MALAVLRSRGLEGLAAPEVTVEVHLAAGLPAFTLVGLPDTEVREARDRVRAAIQNCGFEFPQRRITVNLAPADLPKESGRFDLPIALGILIASGSSRRPNWISTNSPANWRSPASCARCAARWPCAPRCRATSRTAGAAFVLPLESAPEAALIEGMKVLPAATCCRCAPTSPAANPCRHSPCRQRRLLALSRPRRGQGPGAGQARAGNRRRRRPQPAAQRAAGRRQIDAGATPARTPAADDHDEALESRRGAFAGGHFRLENGGQRPFRAPHHTASAPRWSAAAARRVPAKSPWRTTARCSSTNCPNSSAACWKPCASPWKPAASMSRARRAAPSFPARFQLVAAMNPCPCGWLGHASGKCRCTPDQVARYRGKLSGPLLDRIDLMLDVPAVSEAEIARAATAKARRRCAPASRRRASASRRARASPMPADP
jgi:magnesium chelatase family protein